MKRIAFRIPKRQERAIIKVDDVDAARFKTEYWRARMNQGHLEIYKMDYGVCSVLGRALLGIKEDQTCVLHKNDDETDYRRANLMPISRKAHTSLLNLLAVRRGHGIAEYCKRGHLLNEANRMTNGKSGTICRTCNNMRSKRSYEIRKSLKVQKLNAAHDS